jgi:hypothetical protein
MMPSFLGPVMPNSLGPGTVVSIWVFPFFRHRGIVSDRFVNYEPMVISSSARAGGVVEETWSTFAAGQRVYVEDYPSDLPPWVVVQRARSLVGVKYNLLNANCEHLAAYAHGGAPDSPQVAFVVAVSLVAGLLAIVAG